VAAKSYIEYLDLDGEYGVPEFGNHLWNTVIEYRIEHDFGEWWCASIEGGAEICRHVHLAPWTVMASAEVHESPMNELDTFFSDIYYQSSSGNWYRFNQHLWLEEFPYSIAKYDPSYFRTYRLSTNDIFIPLILR